MKKVNNWKRAFLLNSETLKGLQITPYYLPWNKEQYFVWNGQGGSLHGEVNTFFKDDTTAYFLYYSQLRLPPGGSDSK